MDDTKVVVGGTTVAADDFEANLGGWSAADGEWSRTGAVSRAYAAVSTGRTVTLGFGPTGVTLRKALRSLR